MKTTRIFKMSTLSFASVFVSACLVFTSCSSSVEDEEAPKAPEKEEFHGSVGLVMSYDKFLTSDDVMILTSDTTEISVSNAFINSQDIKIQKNAPVCIWRTQNTVPFIRIIEDYKEENGKVKLITRAGEIGDMFEDAEFNMNTEIYVDNNAESYARTRGFNGVEGINPNRYTDENNVVHPAVIIVESENVTRAAAENIAYTAEELMADNKSWKFINIHKKGIDKTINLDKNGYAKFFIKDMHFDAESQLNLSAKIKWFKLKNFECSLSGYAEAGITTGFELDYKYNASKEAELFSGPSHTAVFMVGVVPVAIKMSTGVRFKGVVNASAQCYASATAKFRADYKAGVQYSGGWSPIHTASTSASAGIDKVTGAVSADAKAGVFLWGDVMLYGCAGPELALGPNLKANFNSSYKYMDGKSVLNVKSTGKIALDGSLSAKLSIAKWTLAKWSKDFTICEKTIWNVEKNY